MFDGFRKGLLMLFGRQKPGPSPEQVPPPGPQELSSREARLKVRQNGDSVHLSADFSEAPICTLPGCLEGPMSTVRGQVGGRDALLLSFPLQVAGKSHKIQVTVARHGNREPGPDFELVRANRRRVPPADQALEFVFADHDSQLRYLVEMDLEIPPVGFREFTRSRAVFEEVPPVSQMVAFLKATIHHRRTTLRSLTSLVRRVEEAHVRQVVASMQETLSQSHDFSNLVLSDLQRDLQACGRTVNPNTLGALALLADIYLGGLTHFHIEALVEKGQPLENSIAAAEAVAGFLGVDRGDPRWRELRSHLDPPVEDEVKRCAAFLQGAVGQRTALTILADLAEDSGSERSRSRVARLMGRVPPEQVLTNDEHEALRAYLVSIGRPIQPDTLAALGIYVDFEAGILSEEDIDALTPHRGFLDTSLYGMVAISGAFDAELRPFRLQADRQAQLWEGLTGLLGVTRGGIVARFLESDQPGYLTMCVTTSAEVEELHRKGLTFTGEILAQLPLLEHLHEADLDVFAAAQPGLMACFGSDDKRVQWRRLDSVRRPTDPGTLELLRGNHNFVDGYNFFHFLNRAVGSRVPVDEKKLKKRKNFVAVYQDQRGNAHYRYYPRWEAAVLEPPQHGVEWAGQVVEFPNPRLMPSVLHEPSHDFLLGRPEERGLRQQRLDRIYAGLENYLTRPWLWYNLAQHPYHLARLRHHLKSPALRALLVGIVDSATRNALLAALAGQAGQRVEVELAEPLLQGLDLSELVDFTVLMVLYQMCLEVELPGHRKFYHREKFRDLLLDRLFALADSSDPVVRMQACRLMGTGLVALSPQQQLAVSYVLSRCLEGDRPMVARAAARSLAALGLEEQIPLPDLAGTRLAAAGRRRAGKKKQTVDPAEVEELESELREWSSGAGPSAAARRLEDPARAQALTRWMADVNQSFREDASLAEHRFLLLLPESRLDELLAASVAAWRAFAEEAGVPLLEVLEVEDRAHLVRMFRDHCGPRRPWLEKVEVFHLEPSQASTVGRPDSPQPLFFRAAEMLEPGVESSLRLVRWLPDPDLARRLAE
ncbi:MAG: hypothetical protein AB1758_16615, partial [Candidatus Eremiobacterota bacterium]